MKRRASLALLGIGALGAGCEKPDHRSRVALSGLPAGGRLVIEHAGEPVELRHTPEGVRARSLLCTHYGCRVAWQPAREQYVCPCHQGVFDPDGRPVVGLPTRPLRTVSVAVVGETALVGEP